MGVIMRRPILRCGCGSEIPAATEPCLQCGAPAFTGEFPPWSEPAVIEVEVDPDRRSYREIEERVPADMRVLRSEIRAGGGKFEAKGKGSTIPKAFKSARRSIPAGAVVVAEQVIRQPSDETTVEAHEEAEARRSVERGDCQAVSVSLIRTGRRAFFFQRKRPNTYRVVVSQPAEVSVTYQMPMIVRGLVVTAKRYPLWRLVLNLWDRKLADSHDRAARADVFQRIAEWGDAAARPLVYLLTNEAFCGHAEAAELLGVLRVEAAVHALGETVLHKHPGKGDGNAYCEESQLAAISALAAIGSREGLPYLEQALALNYDWDRPSVAVTDRIREAAAAAIIRLDASREAALVEARQRESDARVAAEEDKRRRVQAQVDAARAKVRSMSDAEMIPVLNSLCDAYASDSKVEIERLEYEATAVGEVLDARGGIAEMRRVFAMIPSRPGKRTLEMHWGGIGDWRG
jgi:hypothetical protein